LTKFYLITLHTIGKSNTFIKHGAVIQDQIPRPPTIKAVQIGDTQTERHFPFVWKETIMAIIETSVDDQAL
jgi:hypothetical protein